MAEDMQEPENIKYVPQETEDEINLDNMALMGLNAPDFPELRKAIRMYAYIQYAAAIILKVRGENIKVLAVRDTKELLVDGRPALEVVTDQAEGVYFKMRTSTLIPIETVNELVSRMMSGEMPFKPENKAIERF